MQLKKTIGTLVLVVLLVPVLSFAIDVDAYTGLKLTNPYSDRVLQVDITGNIPGGSTFSESIIIPPDKSAIVLKTPNTTAELKAAFCGNFGVDVCISSTREISVSGGEIIRGKVVVDKEGNLEMCVGVGGSIPALVTLKGDAFLCLDSDQNLSFLIEGAVGAGAVAVGSYRINITKIPVGPNSKITVSNFKITYPTSSTSDWNKEIRGTIDGEWVRKGGAFTGVITSFFGIEDWRALANAGYKIKVFIETNQDYYQGDATIYSDGTWSLNICYPTEGTTNTIYARLYDPDGKRIATSKKTKISLEETE